MHGRCRGTFSRRTHAIYRNIKTFGFSVHCRAMRAYRGGGLVGGEYSKLSVAVLRRTEDERKQPRTDLVVMVEGLYAGVLPEPCSSRQGTVSMQIVLNNFANSTNSTVRVNTPRDHHSIPRSGYSNAPKVCHFSMESITSSDPDLWLLAPSQRQQYRTETKAAPATVPTAVGYYYNKVYALSRVMVASRSS